MDLKEISFRKALKILVDGGVVLVRNPEQQEKDLCIKMDGENGAVSSSDGCYYCINDFGCKNDHYYDVSSNALTVAIKSGEYTKNYIVVPNLEKDSEKLTIDLKDFINK